MKKRTKILLATLAMVFLAVLIGGYAYLSDYYHANDLAIEAMAVQEDEVPVEQDGVLNRDSYEKDRKTCQQTLRKWSLTAAAMRSLAAMGSRRETVHPPSPTKNRFSKLQRAFQILSTVPHSESGGASFL